jgi:hypothetical protein
VNRSKDLTCAAAKKRLEAFHDRELAVVDEIAVSSHLSWCDHCAAELAELEDVRGALMAFAPARELRESLSGGPGTPRDDDERFTAVVINRMKAEREASFLEGLRELFMDMRPVYVSFGGIGATALFVMIMLGMLRFATSERPDSLAAMVSVLAAPHECDSDNDFTDVSGCRARWEARYQRANEDAELDAVFTLQAAVVTRGGHLANHATLRAQRRRGEPAVIDSMLDAMSRSRIDLQAPQVPQTIWLVEHATVRASANRQPALDLQLPPAKKRAEAPVRGTVRA